MKSKILKIIWLLPLLISMYILLIFLSVLLTMKLTPLLPISFGGFGGFSWAGMIATGLIYLIVFFICYQFLYKRIQKPNFFLRTLLYSLFISFSFSFLFLLFDSILPYSHFLRFRISSGFSSSFFYNSVPSVTLASIIGYLALTLTFELKNQFNNFIKPLICWVFSIILGWYLSIPMLILHTGIDYQKKCIFNDWAKKLIASDYC